MALITGTFGDDIITPVQITPGVTGGLPTNGADLINGREGNDVINGGQGADTIHGGAGDDILEGGAGLDIIHGGIGDDTIVSDGDGGQYFGDAGNDLMISGLGPETMHGGDGVDTIDHRAWDGGYTFDMTTGLTDWAGEMYAEFENVFMGNGNDRVTGSVVKNRINGGGGDDILAGGLGRDRLTGGAGSDRFVFGEIGRANSDIITDFTPGLDRIVLKDSLDAGLPGEVSGGIEGLLFDGGNVAGNSLVFSFAKGPGSEGFGIGVDTSTGTIYYNPTVGQPGDTQILGRVGLAAAAAMNATDFIYGI
jgi:Ca2+-binding RTX toxin-like protein